MITTRARTAINVHKVVKGAAVLAMLLHPEQTLGKHALEVANITDQGSIVG